MNFFDKNKLKVKIENLHEGIKFNIQYNKSNILERSKLELLKKVIGSEFCLIVFNTEIMYKDQTIGYRADQQQLLNKLDSTSISYRKVTVKRQRNMEVLGISVRKSDSDTYEDNIIGAVVHKNNIEDIECMLNSYNIKYFINCNKYNVDELLNKFESSYNDEEKLKSDFQYVLFDDNFIKRISLVCKKDDSDHINNIIEGLNKDLR